MPKTMIKIQQCLAAIFLMLGIYAIAFAWGEMYGGWLPNVVHKIGAIERGVIAGALGEE